MTPAGGAGSASIEGSENSSGRSHGCFRTQFGPVRCGAGHVLRVGLVDQVVDRHQHGGGVAAPQQLEQGAEHRELVGLAVEHPGGAQRLLEGGAVAVAPVAVVGGLVLAVDAERWRRVMSSPRHHAENVGVSWVSRLATWRPWGSGIGRPGASGSWNWLTYMPPMP